MYLLIFRGGKHLFSFYVNSAKKRIVVGGDEGDILFPPEMRVPKWSFARNSILRKKSMSM